MNDDAQGELIPHEAPEEEDKFSGLSASQLIMKFPDLAPPQYVPGECRKMDESKRYNGQRFERDHPEACKWIIKCLAEGMGYRPIIALGGPKYYVIKAIALNHRIDVDKHRNHLSNMHGLASEVWTEKSMELADTCKSGKDAAVASAVHADKHLQLAGDTTLKIELTHNVNIHAEINGLLKEAREKLKEMKAVPAEVIDIDPHQAQLANG